MRDPPSLLLLIPSWGLFSASEHEGRPLLSDYGIKTMIGAVDFFHTHKSLPEKKQFKTYANSTLLCMPLVHH